MERTKLSIAPNHSRIPYWARSTNPIVRRHLGLYWRTLPPQLEPLLKIFLGWAILLALNIIFPFVIEMMMPLFVVSLLTIPAAFFLYAHVLYTIAYHASQMMAVELHNNTMPLLMTTPMTLAQILLGKIAAALWRRMDDWMAALQITIVFAPPILVMNIARLLDAQQHGGVFQIFIIANLLAVLLRIALEPFMVGALAIMVGALVPYRSTAFTVSLALTAFYFVFLNLIVQLPTILENPWLYVMAHFVLPIILPLLIILFSLRVTMYVITQD